MKVYDCGDLNEDLLKSHYQDGESSYKDVCDRILNTLIETVDAEYPHARNYLRDAFEALNNKGVSNEMFFKIFVPSYPIMKNVTPKYNRLPFSCYIISLKDDYNDIINNVANVGRLTKFGGGIGVDFSNLRPRGNVIKTSGSKTNGIIPYMKIYEQTIVATQQSDNRWGAITMYLRVDHPEIETFINSKNKTGGDSSNKLVHSSTHIAVKLTKKFMDAVHNDRLTGNLTEPSFDLTFEGEVVSSVNALTLFEQIVQIRMTTGNLFIMFDDNVKNSKHKSGDITMSNLCTEILIDTKDKLGMCCIGNINYNNYFHSEFPKKEVNEAIILFLQAIYVYAKRVIDLKIESEKTLDAQTLSYYNYFLESFDKTFRSYNNIAISFFGYHDAYANYVNRMYIEGNGDKIVSHAVFELMFVNVLKGFREDALQLYGDKCLNKGLIAIAPTNSTSKLTTNSPNIDAHDHGLSKATLGGKSSDVEISYMKDDFVMSRMPYKSHYLHISDVEGRKAKINLYSSVQKEVDQSISLTLAYEYDAETPDHEVYKAIYQDILYAHKMGIKTLYYTSIRQVNDVSNKSCDLTKGCLACES